MSNNRKKGPMSPFMIVVVIVGGFAMCLMCIAGMAAKTTTSVATAQSNAQVAQARAHEAEQIARQEAERTQQTETMMQPALTASQIQYNQATTKDELDKLVYRAIVDLAMEDFHERDLKRAGDFIGRVFVPLIVGAFIWAGWSTEIVDGVQRLLAYRREVRSAPATPQPPAFDGSYRDATSTEKTAEVE